MRKFQLFLIVEGLLLALALMTILADDLYSFVLIVTVLLLVLRYYSLGNRSNFILTASLLLLFLIFMLNPFVILAILLGLVYMMVNFFAQVKAKNRYALLTFEEAEVKSQRRPSQWLGACRHLTDDRYDFEDINILRLSGADTIDLSQVILKGRDNVIILRKVYGPTRILVPIDVVVSLDVSAVYGRLTFLDYPDYDLRNESLKLVEDHYDQAVRSVKILINVIAGPVEVIRR